MIQDTAGTNMITVQNLSVSYGDYQVLKNVNFSVQEGQWLMLVGPNGAGKSTILNAISGNTPYKGTILFRDLDVRSMKSVQLARHIGILAQNHMVGYDFTVDEIVNLGRYAYRQGLFGTRGEDDESAVQEALKAAGLLQMRNHSVLSLSGGEVQRTFLAQLFAQNPDIMILDEPANHLDLVYQKQVFELIRQWVLEPGRAVISVVHDLSLAKAYGTHCLLLHRGEAVSFGETSQVLSPEHLQSVYEMDVYGWMRRMLEQW